MIEVRSGLEAEKRWTIFKEKDDTPEFYYNIRGPIDDYEKLPIVLPWIGKYSVEMRLYDLFNNVLSTQVIGNTNMKNGTIKGHNVFAYN